MQKIHLKTDIYDWFKSNKPIDKVILVRKEITAEKPRGIWFKKQIQDDLIAELDKFVEKETNSRKINVTVLKIF